jgi:hypothetical protein
MRTMLPVSSFVLLLATASCGEERTSAPVAHAAASEIPAVVWDINGTITRLGPTSVRFLASALVEQPPEISSGSPLDVVNVTRSTKILRQSTDGLVYGSVADLRVGTKVKAWYIAYVAPPFPRQVEARVILIVR